MVLLDEGLDELATQFGPLIAFGQWGTGTALPTPSDTGLGSAVAETKLAPSATASGNSVQFLHEVNSTLGNGFALVEFELQFDSGDSLLRTTGGTINKTNSYTLTTFVTINFLRTN